jgi:hypothetical protein
MTDSAFHDRVEFVTNTQGQGSAAVGAATPGFRTPAQAGIADATVASWLFEDSNDWEISQGTYSGGVVSRDTLLASSTGAKLNLSGGAIVSLVAAAADLTALRTATLKIASNLSDLNSASTARTNLGLAIGSDVQAFDADLTSWAGVTRASGFDTFAATPSSANLAALVTDETGTGALVFGTSPGFTTAANPASNDGAALGTTALGWSDLFLASGGVINWNNGNVILTHSANALNMDGKLVISFSNVPALEVTTTLDSAFPTAFQFRGNRATPTAGDRAISSYFLNNASGAQKEAARFSWYLDTITAGSEEGHIELGTMVAGAFAVIGQLNKTGIRVGGSLAARSTTEPTNALTIVNGTAPVGTLTNAVQLYSTVGELRVMDAAGNATLLSPHDTETNEWIYHSVDTTTGKRLVVNMERLVKAVDSLLGGGYVHTDAVDMEKLKAGEEDPLPETTTKAVPESLSGLIAELAALKAEVGTLKDDVATLKVANLPPRVQELEQKVGQ